MEKTLRNYPIYAGISTFMRAPYVIGTEDLRNYDIAVLGVPLDYGASYREGTKHAPRSIREHSHWDDLHGGEYYDCESEATLEAWPRSIADVGDVTVYPTNPEETNAEIIRCVSEVRKKTFPLILGGDHSITYASFKGCHAGLPEDQKPLGLLHFDAHLDVEENFGVMPEIWHGNPFRKLIEEKILNPCNMVSIGPRGIIPQKWIEYGIKNHIRLFTTPEIRKRGIQNIIDETITHFKEKCSSLYVTFDIDCIDPSQAPGTGTPCVGGLKAEELLPVMRRLSELPVVAFDLVEVNPILDPSGKTSVVACDVLWNFLAFGLGKKLS